MMDREPTAQVADADGSVAGWKHRRAGSSGPAVNLWRITAGGKLWVDSTDIERTVATTASVGADVACMPHDKHERSP